MNIIVGVVFFPRTKEDIKQNVAQLLFFGHVSGIVLNNCNVEDIPGNDFIQLVTTDHKPQVFTDSAISLNALKKLVAHFI